MNTDLGVGHWQIDAFAGTADAVATEARTMLTGVDADDPNLGQLAELVSYIEGARDVLLWIAGAKPSRTLEEIYDRYEDNFTKLTREIKRSVRG